MPLVRETAPAAAGEGLFVRSAGTSMGLRQALVGGRSVGVPGAVRMLETAHRAPGRAPWAQLMQPAIHRAERGFRVSPHMHSQLGDEQALKDDPVAGPYFFGADGAPSPLGYLLKKPALSLAQQGTAPRCTRARWRWTSWRACVVMGR